MHSFVLVGDNKLEFLTLVNKLLDPSWLRLNYEVKSIEQVREITKFTKLSVAQNTAILVTGLDKASTEAQNSFLKSLEEPQENLKFIINVATEQNLIDTILSRAQVIYLKPKKQEILKTFEDFSSLSVGQKLAITTKLKKREEAVEFLKSVIYAEHQKINNRNLKILSQALKTLKALDQNGNVGLQLTNFAISIS